MRAPSGAQLASTARDEVAVVVLEGDALLRSVGRGCNAPYCGLDEPTPIGGDVRPSPTETRRGLEKQPLLPRELTGAHGS